MQKIVYFDNEIVLTFPSVGKITNLLNFEVRM